MALLQTVVGLTFLVVLGNVLGYFFKKIPVSLFQIALGLLVAIFLNVKIELDTEWFLLLFIAPLLYSDAWRFPKKELWELRGPIFGNAILLVFITTIVGGFLIYWMVPELPLPVALAIAAILSPTDPVAVSAIASQAKLPPSIMHLVAGESLINDASGLVGFKFAVAAATAGTFSLWQATGEFFYVSIMGTLVGALMGFILNAIGDWLSSHGNNDVSLRVVLQLFTPFLVYILAEEINASGVIAVVVAAIILNIHTKHDVDYTGELHVVGINTWNVFGYLLNGYIFVILGIEFPLATHLSAAISLPMALFYSVVTWLIIFGIRVIWTYVTQWVRLKNHKNETASWRVAITSGLTGVRGAVTMAGVLSVPLVTDSGAPFPQRALMLFIAAITIILSLIMAIVLLPIVGGEKKTQVPPGATKAKAKVAQHMSEPRARVYVLQSAVREIEARRRESNQAVVYDIIRRYQSQIRQLQLQFMKADKMSPILDAEMTLREFALETERGAVQRLLVDERISPLVFASEGRRIDRAESELDDLVTHDRGKRTWRQIRRFFTGFGRMVRVWLSDDSSDKLLSEYQLARHEASKEAIAAISKYISTDEAQSSHLDQTAAYNLIIMYRAQIERERHGQSSVKNAEALKMELELIGLNAQREAVQHLTEAHFISGTTSLNIRQNINFTEAGMLTNLEE
ncbi:Na+/H+ antiporter [Weissella sagaensis]|jgi:CPA1 family monovalent cation:H+ antiporter|uniref:Na+/H+ antiporter n=1 Tax=Weissella sagaensis TaxID=2559928 RepID=UPI0005A771C6|nr:Na+/H+ antiporter [Weissella sagaensis]KAA8435112.1 Na+/H+ antiporter [Weissella paramesenteroides]QDJ58423.1 Na+/H+ antiporter [Weissella hellenica]KAA8439003.1 Na+/H+ antiporter [Weissella paramesenteroides]QEA57417.1 Na+/H+ antiporter [Weissella hellenica]UEG66528.1 Na+/H+ antiporter [Weissella hellenica]